MEHLLGPARTAIGTIIQIFVQGEHIERVEVVGDPGKNLPVVFPGLIDMHVHFRQPGNEHKETLYSGSRAAIFGGVTTVGDMPNNTPVTNSYGTIQNKIRLSHDAPGSFFFHIIAAENNYAEIERCFEEGSIRAVKLFMGESTDTFGLSKESLRHHFELISSLDQLLMIHAEDDETIEHNKTKYPAEAAMHSTIRSEEAEYTATAQALELAVKYKTRCYFCHVSGRKSFETIVSAKKDGLEAYIEVTPHHLYLDDSYLTASGNNPFPSGNYYKVNPPIRQAATAEFLRSKIRACGQGIDQIDSIGTDHAPHLPSEKEKSYQDAPSGLPAIELYLPLIAQFYHQGQIDLTRLEDLLVGSKQRIFRLHDRGSIKEGMRADLLFWDPSAKQSVGAQHVHSKCGWSPYQGMELHGWPVQVFVGGKLRVDQGKFCE